MRLPISILALLAAIVVPYLLFEETLSRLGTELLAQRSAWWLSPAIAALLAADVFLPVPSSVLATAAGYLLGFAAGAFTNTLGLSAGCWLGFEAGRGTGRRLLQNAEREQVQALWQRYGDWTLILTRGVPVLAEASVLFAGFTGTDRRRFLILTTLANAGIGTVYALVGSFALQWNSFLAAFLGSVALPALALAIMRWKWPKY